MCCKMCPGCRLETRLTSIEALTELLVETVLVFEHLLDHVFDGTEGYEVAGSSNLLLDYAVDDVG
jgi:hypothetical protein